MVPADPGGYANPYRLSAKWAGRWKCGRNFVNYTLIGNPDAPRPDVTDQEDIPIGTPSDTAIEGMNLIWQDEFNGTTLDNSKWNYETGYYLNDDPNTWGWGNSSCGLYQ